MPSNMTFFHHFENEQWWKKHENGLRSTIDQRKLIRNHLGDGGILLDTHNIPPFQKLVS